MPQRQDRARRIAWSGGRRSRHVVRSYHVNADSGEKVPCGRHGAALRRRPAAGRMPLGRFTGPPSGGKAAVPGHPGPAGQGSQRVITSAKVSVAS